MENKDVINYKIIDYVKVITEIDDYNKSDYGFFLSLNRKFAFFTLFFFERLSYRVEFALNFVNGKRPEIDRKR